MAGRVSGYPQLALALGGLAMSVVFGGQFFVWYFQHRSEFARSDLDPFVGLHDIWIASRGALLGFGVFLAGWLWALASSSAILRAAKAAERKAEPPRLG
jgi:hypothetical protein